MTYCLAINVEGGLLMMADTRTNAGVDNISRFRKLFTFELPGERAIALMTSGNLSITQGVLTRINATISEASAGGDTETILNCLTMYRAAELVGQFMRELMQEHASAIREEGVSSDANIILAGQRKGGRPRVFLIYSSGNFIETTRDTPFFQIGEHKYGKPILDRVITPATPLDDVLKAALVSMDSTLRSNLSVGMPLDLVMLPVDAQRFSVQTRIEPGDAAFDALSKAWAAALRNAFIQLPDVTLNA